jgi:hypothetical protein
MRSRKPASDGSAVSFSYSRICATSSSRFSSRPSASSDASAASASR